MTKSPKGRVGAQAAPSGPPVSRATSLDAHGPSGLVGELPAEWPARLLERLRDARIAEGRPQALHLAAITGRAYQTTRRWIDVEAPGLPDLESFRLLCQGMDSDPAWLLGLTSAKRSLKEASSSAGAAGTEKRTRGDWLDEISEQVSHSMHGCEARRMRGDEMDPEIADGDTFFVDMHVCDFEGNGNYLVSCDGRELVRRLEYRMGTGLILSCANLRYSSVIVEDAPRCRDKGLRILGRIEGVIQVRKFWRQSGGGVGVL